MGVLARGAGGGGERVRDRHRPCSPPRPPLLTLLTVAPSSAFAMLVCGGRGRDFGIADVLSPTFPSLGCGRGREFSVADLFLDAGPAAAAAAIATAADTAADTAASAADAVGTERSSNTARVAVTTEERTGAWENGVLSIEGEGVRATSIIRVSGEQANLLLPLPSLLLPPPSLLPDRRIIDRRASAGEATSDRPEAFASSTRVSMISATSPRRT